MQIQTYTWTNTNTDTDTNLVAGWRVDDSTQKEYKYKYTNKNTDTNTNLVAGWYVDNSTKSEPTRHRGVSSDIGESGLDKSKFKQINENTV